MELGWNDDVFVENIENDENCDSVETTELADDRMVNPNSTSTLNQVVLSWSLSLSL